jgi:hypothetical protein
MTKTKKHLTIVALTVFSISCSPDCKDDVTSYNQGHSAGKLAKHTNDNPSCSTWASEMAKQGFNVDANSCYCAGFSDGKSGNENKYK